MSRSWNLLFHGPLFPLLLAVSAVTLFCYLRFYAIQTASYRAMVAEFGDPSPLERFFGGAFLAACYALVLYRLVSSVF